MQKNKNKNSVERIIKDPTYTIYSKGGVAKNGSKPTQNGQNNNVVPFPIKPGTPIDEWYKTAKKSDYLELLVGMAGFKEDALKDLTESELKELLQYTIDTGGFGG